MTLRKWLASAAVAAGTALGATAPAADPAKPDAAKPLYTFGTMKAAAADAAKAKAAAYLKAAGKLDQKKLDAAFADDTRTVHDRTVEALLLGVPEFAAVLAEARKADAPAPMEVPAALKDDKLDAFAKANLANAYLKALAGRRVYEEGLEATKGVVPEQLVDPSGYYFYKAVAEHALVRREEAVASIIRLLDDVLDAPDRYRVVATLMFFDLQNWSKDQKDLGNIAKWMDNSERRLDLARPGQQTQDIQKKIVFRLDEKIKELEAKAKQQPGGGGGGGGGNGGGCPDCQGPPGGGTTQPNAPAGDSVIMGGSGKGEIDLKALRNYEAQWGKLPPAERQKIVQQVIRDFPPKFKPIIEDYFRTLNRMNGYNK